MSGDTTTPIPGEVRTLAIAALHDMPGIECDHIDGKTPCCERDADAVLAAAVPVLLATERERIATAIEDDDWFDPDEIMHNVPDYREGLEYATARHASIARTTTGTDHE